MNNRILHNLKYLSAALIVTLMIVLAAMADYAEAGQGVINYDVVNIRSGPGTNYQIAGTIIKDSKVTILKTQGDWKQISFGKITGWIAGQYIDAIGIGEIVLIADWANLRSGPGTNYTAIGKVTKGESYTLLSKDGDWYHILTSSGQEAYVAGYLAKVSSATQTTTGSSNKPSSSGTASSTGNKAVSVILNDNTMSFEVPPIIENGRTLVPLRAIFEAMGAVVEWNEETRTVIASKGSNVVVLPLNSTKPTVNGKFYTLEVPAKIVQNRTLAPLRFVAEAFGGQVDWNESTKTVKITAASTGTIDKPSVVTAKVQDVYLRNQPSSSGTVVTVIHPGDKLNVLDEKNEWYQVSRGGTTGWVASWLMEASTGSDSTTPSGNSNSGTTGSQGSTAPVTTEAGNAVHVARTSDNTGIKITISSGESFEPEIKQTSGVIQYDLGEVPLASFNNVDEAMGDGRLTIKSTTVEERNVVTIGLPAWVKYQLTSVSNQKYIVTIPNCITSIEKTPFGSVGDRFIVHSLSPITGQTGTLNGSQLEVKIPGTTLKTGYSLNATGTLFDRVDLDEDDNNVTLTIDTNNLGHYSFATTGSSKDLNIVLMRKMETHTGEKIVVLDPGHGGTAPGSCGTILKEKDVNMAVALKTGALLQQRGIKVEYTRTDDTTMALSEEVAVANEIGATVFVSMHCNSCDTPGPSGTETYFYAPLEVPELYIQRDDRSRLANLIQAKMIANLQLTNRGVKDNKELYVLNHTNMPSALVEMGFMNNPDEEKKLGDDHFRDLAAQAIADAIQEYLQGS